MSVDLILVVAQEQPRDLPMPPVVFGVIAFGLLVMLLLGLLTFGKGRPHS